MQSIEAKASPKPFPDDGEVLSDSWSNSANALAEVLSMYFVTFLNSLVP